MDSCNDKWVTEGTLNINTFVRLSAGTGTVQVRTRILGRVETKAL